MRLWHQALLPHLDRKRLFGLHCTCCALRGKGWDKKYGVVDYVFNYGLDHLYAYHILVMGEMARRFNASIDSRWYSRTYRGKSLPPIDMYLVGSYVYWTRHIDGQPAIDMQPIYAEHDDAYLRECLLDLKARGAELVNGKTVDRMLVELDLREDSLASLVDGI